MDLDKLKMREKKESSYFARGTEQRTRWKKLMFKVKKKENQRERGGVKKKSMCIPI